MHPAIQLEVSRNFPGDVEGGEEMARRYSIPATPGEEETVQPERHVETQERPVDYHANRRHAARHER